MRPYIDHKLRCLVLLDPEGLRDSQIRCRLASMATDADQGLPCILNRRGM